jgi:hypothetical protein
MSCVIFWVVLRRMVFNSRRFETQCLFYLHRRVDVNEDGNLWCGKQVHTDLVPRVGGGELS